MKSPTRMVAAVEKLGALRVMLLSVLALLTVLAPFAMDQLLYLAMTP